MDRSVVLNTANELINNDRDKIYGNPKINHERIAKLWSVVLSKDITANEVALCMAMVKTARLIQTPDHIDSYVDGSAYFAIACELATENTK